MTTFHGAFIFRDHGHGILSSTYLNTGDPQPYPETAILKSGVSKEYPFVGIYETIWLEKKDNYKCTLVISKGSGTSYDLLWHTAGQNEFKGIGILENALLVGCYWNV